MPDNTVGVAPTALVRTTALMLVVSVMWVQVLMLLKLDSLQLVLTCLPALRLHTAHVALVP